MVRWRRPRILLNTEERMARSGSLKTMLIMVVGDRLFIYLFFNAKQKDRSHNFRKIRWWRASVNRLFSLLNIREIMNGLSGF